MLIKRHMLGVFVIDNDSRDLLYRTRAFTLLEVMVVLIILVLAAAVIVPMVGKTNIADLRSTAGKVAGTIRATYDQAALSGRKYRLVFDLTKQIIKIESDNSKITETPGLFDLANVLLGNNGKITEDESVANSDNADEKIKEVQPPAELLSLLGISKEETEDVDELSSYQNAGHDFRISKDVRILDVWVEGMSQPITEDKAFLYFFPGGYTQKSMIHLTTSEGTTFTVKVAGLTGNTEIIDKFVEVPQ
ncbi:MAG: type II secretion system protein [Deltaproteobacteria bacterium]|nr:type II secretion system protein [Deltaproteobacteria bacterium]